MKITISPRAEKELKKLSKIDQIVIAKKIRFLGTSEATGEKKLTGFQNIFRIRVGNYRIVYKKTVSDVFIVLIGHRKDIYNSLKQLFAK